MWHFKPCVHRNPRNQPIIIAILFGIAKNDEEWDVGHFEGAERPKCETFAEMTPETLGLSDANKEEPVMIYCTGGIRCSSPARKGLKGLQEIPKHHNGGFLN